MSDIRTPPVTTASGLAVEETTRMIASDKVEGTAVYDPQGNHLGSIYNLMLDKYSGQVGYAVLSFGGFLGIGSDYYPVPWKKLSYDQRLGGYVVDITREQLERAPHYGQSATRWDEPAFGRSIYDYYDVPFYM